MPLSPLAFALIEPIRLEGKASKEGKELVPYRSMSSRRRVWLQSLSFLLWVSTPKKVKQDGLLSIR
jgi:hypothetical protein